ncbi:MAG TPA: tetratricopeptide repeat protein, partial [Myxococcales bacterium]|nr:tetratricopeptide repeat protein [Myxococcales bacterium]
PRQTRIDGRTAGNALGVWTPGQWPGRMGEVREQLDAALDRQDFAGAQKLVDTAYQLSPGGAFGPFMAGVLQLAHGTSEAAEKDFVEARLAAPRFPAAVAALGRVWSKQGGAANAGQKLMQLAESEPRLASARYLAARAYVEAGDPVKAEAALRRGLTLQPDSPVPYRQLTDYYFGLDRVPEALELVQQGAARFPKDVGLRMMLAQIFVSLGKADDAINVYQDLAKSRPDLDIVQYRLATLLAQKPDRAPFLAILQRLHADQPADPLQVDALGWLFFRGGDLPRSRQLLEAAVQAVPDEPGPRFHLATVCARQGDLPRARQELQTALESPRPFPDRLDAMRLLRESGEEQKKASK